MENEPRVESQEAGGEVEEVSPPAWQINRFVAGMMVLAAILGLLYNYAILPGIAPDETRHIAYVQLLVDEHRLPLVDGNNEYAGAHSQHPPLYYIVQVPFFVVGRLLPDDWGVHLMRFPSLVLCVIAVPLIYGIALAGSSGEVPAARLATALCICLPMYGQYAGSVNNDSAALLVSSWFLWMLVARYPRDTGFKASLMLGLAFALGAAVKSTTIFSNGAALVIYLWMQHGKDILDKRVIGRLAVIAGMTLVLAGPWYVRNILVYGTWQPAFHGYTSAALPPPSAGMFLMLMHPNFPALFGLANWGMFFSVWSTTDWLPEMMRKPLFLLMGACCIAALPGYGRSIWKKRGDVRVRAEGRARRGALYAAFGTSWVMCVMVALFVHWGFAEGGRYLLPTFIGATVFLVQGWKGLMSPRALNVATVCCLAFFGVLNLIEAFRLVSVINPGIRGAG